MVSKYGPNGSNDRVGLTYSCPLDKFTGKGSLKSLDPKSPVQSARDGGDEGERSTGCSKEEMDHDAAAQGETEGSGQAS